ncbi:uncharacterized protein LOC126204100 [Schistocerca nitens]|uniref:uncharacterized protein LOC126204100 n=1 Tax=Schistocerca nitens TaxID=7011 RepID=UPI002117BFE5|nr:uncharacterized protein LOC126204100 [Schistocerca nitens]
MPQATRGAYLSQELTQVKSGLQQRELPISDETATFTWSETAGSLLKVNIRILFFNGAWPLTESALYYVYTAAVFLASLANMAEAAVGIAFGQGGMEEITLVLPNTLTTACGVVKLAFFLRDHRRYYALVRRTERLVMSQEELAGGAAEASARDVSRRVRAFALFVVALICVQGAVWCPMPLIAYPGERKLPFGQLPSTNYTQAEALSMAAYSCQWVESSQCFKRSLAIVILRAQQQLVITAGHLYPVNRTTFVSLVNASYSYYALLGQINKR